MKYTRLTKEQLETLSHEFINFLATQSITAEEWAAIKKDQPAVAEQELDVFSDLIWEGVLSKVQYVESISQQYIQLYQCTENVIRLIAAVITNKEVNLLTEEGFQWFKDHLKDPQVDLYTAAKSYSEDKHSDIFKLIAEGGQITDGTLFKALDKIIN